MIGRLLMELGGGGLRRGGIYGTRIPGAGERRADRRVAHGCGRRSGTGGRVAADQAETSVAVSGDPALGRASRRPDQRIRVDGRRSGRGLPHVLGGGCDRRRVPVLVGGLLALGFGAAAGGGAVRAGSGRAGLRLLAVVGVQLAGCRRRHRRVVRTVRSASALVQRVMVMLAGGVGRHAQPQWEAVRGRHAVLVVVVVCGCSGRLVVVVAAVEARLLEVRIHFWRTRLGHKSSSKLTNLWTFDEIICVLL